MINQLSCTFKKLLGVVLSSVVRPFFGVVKGVVAIFNGILLLWELFATAFIFFISDELAEDIRMSSLARISLVIGFLTTVGVLLHAYKHSWPYIDVIFLAFQGLRLLHFLGRAPDE